MEKYKLHRKIADFMKYYDETQETLEEIITERCNLIEKILKQNEIIYITVSGRVKNKEECIRKFKRKYLKDLEDTEYKIQDTITDLLGLRIICPYESEIKIISEKIKEVFEERESTDKSSELDKTENQFGYRGLHLDLQLDEKHASLPENKKAQNLRFELQIRTITQDAWSVLNHEISYKKGTPIHISRSLNRLAAFSEFADIEFDRIKKEEKAYVDRITEILEKGTPNEKKKLLQTKLDRYLFKKISNVEFPGKFDEESKNAGFVEDLLTRNKKLTNEMLQNAIREYKTDVNEGIKQSTYFKSTYFSAYKIIEYCLYLYDEENNKELLTNREKEDIKQNLIEKHIKNG